MTRTISHPQLGSQLKDLKPQAKSRLLRRSQELTAAAVVEPRPPEPPPPILTITTANDDIHQLDRVSHHYSRLSWKPSYFPSPTQHLLESEWLSRRGRGKDGPNIFLSTYCVSGIWNQKPFYHSVRWEGDLEAGAHGERISPRSHRVGTRTTAVGSCC